MLEPGPRHTGLSSLAWRLKQEEDEFQANLVKNLSQKNKPKQKPSRFSRDMILCIFPLPLKLQTLRFWQFKVTALG
jgi:hypothetical protein